MPEFRSKALDVTDSKSPTIKFSAPTLAFVTGDVGNCDVEVQIVAASGAILLTAAVTLYAPKFGRACAWKRGTGNWAAIPLSARNVTESVIDWLCREVHELICAHTQAKHAAAGLAEQIDRAEKALTELRAKREATVNKRDEVLRQLA